MAHRGYLVYHQGHRNCTFHSLLLRRRRCRLCTIARISHLAGGEGDVGGVLCRQSWRGKNVWDLKRVEIVASDEESPPPLDGGSPVSMPARVTLRRNMPGSSSRTPTPPPHSLKFRKRSSICVCVPPLKGVGSNYYKRSEIDR